MKLELEQQDKEEIAQTVLERLKPLLQNKCSSKPDDKIFSLEELAKHLDVPTSWVYKQVHLCKIPYFKAGKYTRFKKSDIEKWISVNSVKLSFCK